MSQATPNPDEDIVIFANHCVFVRSIYMHGKILFERSTTKDGERMNRAAPIFFGDLNRILIERLILEVCKITDPPQDVRKNDNHTVAFLLEHHDFSADPAIAARLAALDIKLHDFRKKLLPARNKLISHSDRDAIMAGHALGGVPNAEWNNFWLDLQDFINVIHEKVAGMPFYINGVGMISDADGLLKALKHAECFAQIMREGDSALTHRCADLAFSD